MSREIAISNGRTGVTDMDVIAQRISQSRMFGLDPAQAFTLCLLAESEGLPPIQAVRRFHVINGRPSMRADAMQAEFQRHGGTVEWLLSTAEECRAVFRHPVHAPKGFEVHLTLKELVDRGVAKNPTYRTYPRQMLRARVISEGVRAVDPGIVVGIYTPEEAAELPPIPKVIEVRPAAAREAEAIGAELTRQMDEPTPREKAQARQRERNPEPRGNPAERHPAPADVAAEMDRHDRRTYREAIAEAVAGADAEWKAISDDLGLEFEPVVNAFQVENHLATWALDEGVLKPEHIETDGKRDREKPAAALAKLHRKNPERFAGLVAAYVAGKIAEKRRAAEAYLAGPPAEEQSQEPPFDVEAAVAEVFDAEPVA